jgi:hypothetical protein
MSYKSQIFASEDPNMDNLDYLPQSVVSFGQDLAKGQVLPFHSHRREFLDQTFFWTATDLERKLLGYQQYFNHHRTHSGLDGGIPVCTEAMAINLNEFCWQRHCRGLVELPVAA